MAPRALCDHRLALHLKGFIDVLTVNAKLACPVAIRAMPGVQIADLKNPGLVSR